MLVGQELEHDRVAPRLSESTGRRVAPDPPVRDPQSVAPWCRRARRQQSSHFAHELHQFHPLTTPSRQPKLLVVNYPHNPTSKTVDPEFFVEVVKLARRYGFMVISDFAYADVAFDGYQPPSFLAAPGAKDVGVEFTTMSKGYNMAGWRIGYCCGNAEMVRALGIIKGYYDYGLFQAIQIAAIVAFLAFRSAPTEEAIDVSSFMAPVV